jgi:hypothetical protein
MVGQLACCDAASPGRAQIRNEAAVQHFVIVSLMQISHTAAISALGGALRRLIVMIVILICYSRLGGAGLTFQAVGRLSQRGAILPVGGSWGSLAIAVILV